MLHRTNDADSQLGMAHGGGACFIWHPAPVPVSYCSSVMSLNDTVQSGQHRYCDAGCTKQYRHPHIM